MIKMFLYKKKKKAIQLFHTLKVFATLRRKYYVSDFIIIGAQKGGTTWLYNLLKQLPNVFMPHIKNTHDPSEVRFYDERLKKGVEWYESLYSDTENLLKGDKTPKYYIMPWYKLLLLKRIQPNVKLIFMLRCPIHRAWSDAIMNFKRFNNIDYEGNEYRYKNYLLKKIHRGLYYKQLKKWYSVFKKEQIHIVIYEEMVHSPKEHSEEIFKFLNLTNSFISNEAFKVKYNANPKKQVPSEITSLLHPYFASDVEKLKKELPNLSFNNWESFN